MGRVVGFSDLERYLEPLRFSETGFVRGCLLDTNILISLTYEVREDAEDVAGLLDVLIEKDFRCFTTVTTRAEFLDFHRKLMMTENLLDAIGPDSGVKIPPRVRAQIQVQQGQLRRYEQQGRDAVFYDSNIKRIKSAFLSEGPDGIDLWKALCEAFLSGKLGRMNEELERLGIAYVSPNESAQSAFFTRRVDWAGAQHICEETCLGMSDSLILNALQCSRFPFVVSADSDLALAVLSSSIMKDVVVPDSIAAKFLGLKPDSDSKNG